MTSQAEIHMMPFSSAELRFYAIRPLFAALYQINHCIALTVLQLGLTQALGWIPCSSALMVKQVSNQHKTCELAGWRIHQWSISRQSCSCGPLWWSCGTPHEPWNVSEDSNRDESPWNFICRSYRWNCNWRLFPEKQVERNTSSLLSIKVCERVRASLHCTDSCPFTNPISK